MFKNYIIIAWRKLKKNKLYSFVNIVGLTAGLASCLLIGVYLKNELTFDFFHKNADRIARLTMEYTHGAAPRKIAVTGSKSGPQMKREFPQVEDFVRTMKTEQLVEYNDIGFNEKEVLYADASFFRIFSFPLVQGTAADALASNDRVVLSVNAANKYFNTVNVVGKTLKIGGKPYTISAVAQNAPNNSQMHFDVVLPFNLLSAASNEQWFSANYVTYLLLKSSSSFAPLQKQITAYMDGVTRNELKLEGNDYLTLKLEPLKRVHLYSDLDGFEPNGSIVYIYILFSVALLTLVIAAVNYTNLAVAQSAGRGGEISIRKVLGANSWQLFRQFIGESFFFTTLATVLAVIAANALLPYFNNMAGKHFTAAELLNPVMLVGLLLLSTLISFVAGAYPSLLLSNVKLADMLKAAFSFTGNTSVRQALIVFQFVVSFFLIISTSVIINQLRFIQSKDIGYNRNNVIAIPINGHNYKYVNTLKNQIVGITDVKSVSVANSSPVDVGWGDGIVGPEGQKVLVNSIPADENFVPVFDLKLLAGSNFTQADVLKMDTSNNNKNLKYTFIINESTAKALGWTPEQAIGKTINKNANGTIKGVVKDFNFRSLHSAITPLIIFLDNNFTNNIFVRIDGRHTQSVLQNLEAVWKRTVNKESFRYNFVDEDYNALYVSEQRTAAIFQAFSFLAILLACLGLFALTAFAVLHRTKEIGIRKVLGASVANITLLLSKNFIKLVMIAIVIASPIAWFVMNKWLQDFAYRISLHWFVFVAAAMVTIGIAFITVSFQSIKAAVTNPVKSLRKE